MNSKIDWFKEVLEMEPGSKVFFPLAKLQVEDGELREAVITLRRGLEKNPDHLEAKLLLVDVLYTCGEKQEASMESAAVSDLLQRYPGFWRTWASQSAGTSPDMAAALEYLAGLFSGKTFTWSDIIRMGVSGMFADASASGSKPEGENVVQDVRQELGDDLLAAGDVDVAGAQVLDEDSVDLAEEVSDLPADALDASGLLEDVEEEAVGKDAAPDFLSGEDAGELEEHSDIDPSHMELSDDDVSFLKGSSEDEPAGEDDPEDEAAVVEGIADEASLLSEQEESLEADREAEQGTKPSTRLLDEDESEVRTKTMADLMAEQGDLKGALEIYEELIETAEGQERDTLIEAADKLRKGSGEGPAEAPPAAAEEQNEIPGRKKIMSTLENLAARLESRARS
jgi:tetratricopeptide (TPR) repeat protein